MSKPRKHIHAELNKNRDKSIDELADMDIENRTTTFEDEDNRYKKIITARKQQKLKREQEKMKKIHIGKRQHIEKRARAEIED